MTRSEAATRRDTDFEQIEAAVMETARGRWFLSEFVRRNRNADTAAILSGLSKLEAVVRRATPAKAPAPPPPRPPSQEMAALRREVSTALAQVRDAEGRLRASIAGLDPMSSERAQLRVALTLYESASAQLGAALGEPAKAKSAPDSPPPGANRRPATPTPRAEMFFEPSVLLSRLSGLPSFAQDPPLPSLQVTARLAPPVAVQVPAAVSAQLDAVLSRLVEPDSAPIEQDDPAPEAKPEVAAAIVAPLAEAPPEPKVEVILPAEIAAAPAAMAEAPALPPAPALPATEPAISTAPAIPAALPSSSRAAAAIRLAAAVRLDRDATNRSPTGEQKFGPPRPLTDMRPATVPSAAAERPSLAVRTATTVLLDRTAPEPPIADDPTATMSRAEKVALFC